MISYLVIPLVASILAVSFACVILVMGVDQRPNRLGAFMMLGIGYWAMCEVLWNVAPDPTSAMAYFQLAGPGYVFIGPLMAHLAVELDGIHAPTFKRSVPLLYGVSGCFLALVWAAPESFGRMEPTSWGNGIVPGPAYRAWFIYSSLVAGWGLVLWYRGTRPPVKARNLNRELVIAFVVIPACLLSMLTDGLLPILGQQWPRVGTLCWTAVGASVIWTLHRFGYSRLSPQAFSRRILSILPDGIALMGGNGELRVVNRRMAQLLGCSAEAAVGLDIRPRLLGFAPSFDHEVRECECDLVSIDDLRAPVSISSAPFYDNDEGVMGAVLIVRDARELNELRTHLVSSGRLAAVGELAAGIAHEINNPLAFVRSNLGTLRRDWNQVSSEFENLDLSVLTGEILRDWEELIDETLEGVDRAALIVRDVKELSHAGEASRESADLNYLIDQALRVASTQFDEGVDVERILTELPLVHCEPQRLKQLFLNLIINAAQAVEGRGTVRIESRVAGEGWIEIAIRDDGCGIEAESLERIFDPFFTTKSVGEGTGLGLSISHEIARMHDGEIRVKSEQGSGTEFVVRIPVEPETR